MSTKLLDLVNIVDNSPYKNTLSSDNLGLTYFLSHDGVVLGKIIKKTLEHLKYVEWLEIKNNTVRITDSKDLSSKFAKLTSQWRSEDKFDCLRGWRDELYTCYTTGGKKYFDIERSAACIFGLVTYGCHISGYIPDLKKIWVPRRSYKKPTFPGMLDNTVAGGLGDGLSFKECAVKECKEEANIEEDYARKNLVSVGVLTYEFIHPETGFYQPEVESIYDLIMAPDVVPKVNDGEVHEFMLMSYTEVIERLLKGEFKYNCALVIIDFLIRHGEIDIDSEPDYIEITSRCHRMLEYPLRRV